MGEGENYTDKININKLTIENALAISSLTQIVGNTSKDVDKLVKHAEKIDALVVHNSKIDGRLGHLETQVKEDKKAIEPVYSFLKYPKLSLLGLVVAYTFTIYEVRVAIIHHLRPIIDLVKWIAG